MGKNELICIRTDSKQKKKFIEKCNELNVSISQLLRMSMDVFIGNDETKELEYTRQTIDKRRYKKILNEDRWIEYSRQLRRIGVNLNQAVKNLNFLLRSGFYEDRPEELKQVITDLNSIAKELTARKNTLDTFIDESRKNV